MSFCELGRRASVSNKTSKLRWYRRGEVEGKVSVLVQKNRVGRPGHHAFLTPDKYKKAFSVLGDLPEGDHQLGAAKKLKVRIYFH